MKLHRETFQPVTITLETPEEASALTHILLDEVRIETPYIRDIRRRILGFLGSEVRNGQSALPPDIGVTEKGTVGPLPDQIGGKARTGVPDSAFQYEESRNHPHGESKCLLPQDTNATSSKNMRLRSGEET